jgi:hypothetical protein
MHATTPDVAVFTNNKDTPKLSNISEIAFKGTDFPVPPCPCTIINCCVGSPRLNELVDDLR